MRTASTQTIRGGIPHSGSPGWGPPVDVRAAPGLRSLAAAAAVGAALLASAGAQPLPHLGWAAAFLVLAVEHDVRDRRIPNGLTLPALGAALAAAAFTGGGAALATAAGGAGLAFALLFGPFALRWLGAGDVKAAMVLGALWGPALLLPALWWMIVVGGLGALAWVAVRGGLPDMARRWTCSLQVSLATRRPTWFGPAPGSPAAGALPFAVAMGLGAAAFQLWGAPWA